VELADYKIHSISQGQDALGEVHVMLKQYGYSVLGRGVSTDILEASAKAYIDAVNRLFDKRSSHKTDRSNVTLI